MGSTPFPCTQHASEHSAEISKGTTKTAQHWTLEDTTALENTPTNAFNKARLLLALQTYAAHHNPSHAKCLSLPAAPPLQNCSWWTGKGQVSSAADGHFLGLEADWDSPVCSANDLPVCREPAFPEYTIRSAQTAQSCPVGSSCPHPLSWKM